MATVKPRVQWAPPVEMVVVTAPVTAGMQVILNAATGIQPAADNNTTGIVGIALNDAAVGEFCQVMTMGICRGQAGTGVNFAPGNDVYTKASHEFDTGSLNDKSCGKVVSSDPASGGEFDFVLQSSLFFDRTTHA